MQYQIIKENGIICRVVVKEREFMRRFSLEESAISIIGGADGPTSIFIAGKLGSGFGVMEIAGIVLLAAVIVAIVVIIRKRKGRK